MDERKTLGLDDVQANALFAWQHNLEADILLNEELFAAVQSVFLRAREVGMSKEELKQVKIDEAWIDPDLLDHSRQIL